MSLYLAEVTYREQPTHRFLVAGDVTVQQFMALASTRGAVKAVALEITTLLECHVPYTMVHKEAS